MFYVYAQKIKENLKKEIFVEDLHVTSPLRPISFIHVALVHDESDNMRVNFGTYNYVCQNLSLLCDNC